MNRPSVIQNAFHVLPVRVYYQDTDAGGIVYHANYLKFAERARAEMMRDLGASPAQILAQTGVSFAVKKCTVDYHAPARLDDALEVWSRITKVGGASLDLEQRIRRDGKILADMQIVLVALKEDGRPTRLPESIKKKIEAQMEKE